MMVLKQEKGFTLIELMVAMVVFVFAMAAATSAFLPLVNQFKQQSRISESQIEEIIGLELLRQDIEHAGYGLPWFALDSDNDSDYTDNWPAYTEAALTAENYAAYNDVTAPRGIVLGNDDGTAGSGRGINNSDYLAVKAVNVRNDDEAQKWTYIYNDIDTGIQTVYDWSDNQRDLAGTTLVTVIRPTVNKEILNVLVTDAGTYYNAHSAIPGSTLSPFDPGESYLLYGIGPDAALRMPFNRADFYIADAVLTTVPSRCATNTGVLMKSIISHADGLRTSASGATAIPLIDCVADMQIILGLDIDDDGTVGTYTDGATIVDAPRQSEGAAASAVSDTLTEADLLRKRLKEVRVYVLSHEGQSDGGFTYGNPTIDVGEFGIGKTTASGNAFDFAAWGITNWQNYRWKVYTMIITPENLNPTQ